MGLYIGEEGKRDLGGTEKKNRIEKKKKFKLLVIENKSIREWSTSLDRRNYILILIVCVIFIFPFFLPCSLHNLLQYCYTILLN